MSLLMNLIKITISGIMDIFKFIKLLDGLQSYSKEAVVNEYELSDDENEDLILSKSIYPTGKPLGFYNYCPNDISSIAKISKENIKDEFLDYIDSFSDNIYDILERNNIEDVVSDMSDNDLADVIVNLNLKTSDDFLTTIYANILAKNNSKITFETNLGDEFLDLSIAAKLKQLIAYDISYKTDDDEIYQLFDFKSLDSNPNYIIHDMAFDEDENAFKEILSLKNSSIVTVSSSFFDENSDLLNHISNPNHLEAVILLPIFKDGDNLMVIVINQHKKSNKFILIDESESLIHKDNDFDYAFANEDLLPNIIYSYKNFNEYENALILPVASLIKKNSSKKNTQDVDAVKRRVYKSDVDQLISLQEQQASIQEQMIRSHKQDVEFVTFDSKATKSSVEELMYNKKRQPLENLLYKKGKKILDEDIEFVNLSEIADLISINQKNDKDTILVAACKQCTSKLDNYIHDIETINVDEYYIEIDNISPDVTKQYLYTYLSSLNGLEEIKYFSKKNHMITPEQLGYVKIPVLKITTQFELVDAVRESEEFFKAIELLKNDFQSNILDYKHVIESISELRGDIEFSKHGDVNVKKAMRHAYSDLIWPLASSYLQATKGSIETVEKKDNYLVLFEFVAAFNFIILLSGLPDNVYQKCKYDIWNFRKLYLYKDMSFGKWVILSKNIAEVYRKNNFSSKLDKELFDKISSKKILKILDKTKDFRNDEHHGAQSNKYEAEDVLNELNIYLKDLFEILEVYSKYKLIYVLKSNDLSHEVILLNGACAPPLYDTLVFDEKLENERLYLYNPKNNKKLLIKDNFMKFAPVDDNKKHWALYIYDSCDRNEYNAFYKCYQSKQDDLKVSIYDFEEDIIG